MKVVGNYSIKFFDTLNPVVQDVVEALVKADKCEAFDTMADIVYAPGGMTHEEWEKWIIDNRDYIINHFQL